MLAELQAKPTTRAEDILSLGARLLGRTTRSRSRSDDPQLDPARSRGGIHELELAIDVMDAVFNGKDEVHPVNVPNRGGALPGFPEDLVVEVYGRYDRRLDRAAARAAAAAPRARARSRRSASTSSLAAEAAWSGDRRDAVRALAANPLVRTLPRAERALRRARRRASRAPARAARAHEAPRRRAATGSTSLDLGELSFDPGKLLPGRPR